jgi:hypothetical protein
MVLILWTKDTDWYTGIKKQDPTICCLYEMQYAGTDKHKLKCMDRKRYSKQIESKSKQE